MTTQRKPLHTHVITLLFVLFQFIQFLPSSLVSSLTASAETSNSVTLFSDDKGSGNAKWSLSEDGKLITWDITVTQNESEAEAAPSVEVVVPANVGAPQVVSATPTGVFTPSGTSHTFTAPYSTTAQTLNLKFTTAVNDLTSPNLAFKIGASIQQKDSPAASLQSVSIPNKLAQLEAERIAAEKAEAERIAAEKAEAERIAAEEKAAQEEADKLAEEERLAAEAAAEEQRLAEEAAKQAAAELEAEQREEDKDTQKEADESEQVADEEEKTEEVVEEESQEENLSNETLPEDSQVPPVEAEETDETSVPSTDEEANQAKEEDERESETEGVSFEEEYDPGDILDGFEATDHPDDPTPISRFAPGSLGSASTLLKSSRSVMQSTTDLEPGEVRTNKTATPVDGMVNTWDITVRIEGRDAQEVETTDVVLVIDRSGSMADNNRMQNAKTAANNFITTMIPQDPNLRIAVVSFSSDYQGAQLVTTNSNFTRNTSTLTSAVNSLNALGGTHTQAGIIQGQSLLTGSAADNKYMVLLSDGEPTFSYEPDNWTTGLPSWGTSGNITASRQQTGVYDGNFDTGSVVGTGSSLTQSYDDTTGPFWNRVTYRRHIHNGFAAIKAGQDARTGFDGLFTIAVEAGLTGTSILNDIASPGLSYSTDNPGELTEIYDEIGTQISTQYALRNVELIDEMGDGFSLIDGTIVTSEGNTSVESNDTITWTIDPAVENLVDGTDDVRYAELTYRVEINDDILDLTGAKTDEHQLFDTNNLTQLSYTDTNDQNQSVNIDSPEVDPVLMKVKKILEGIEQDDRQFIVEISNDDSAYNQTESLIPNTDYIWITTLRYEGLYDVEETGIAGPGNTDLARFITSYDVDGEETTTFEVNHIDGIPRGDVTIDVTNREISFIDLTALKIWEGGPEENKEPVDLTLWRTVDGETLSEVNVAPDVTPAEGPADEFSYTWSDLPNETSDGSEYTYYFTESEVEGYTREYANSIEINAELYGVFDEQYQGTVTNIYQIPADDIEATKTWINGENVRPDLWFQLRRSIDDLEIDEAVDVMKLPVANDAEETVSVIFTDVELTDNDGNAYTFYVVEGTLVDGEFIPGTPENFKQSGEGLALTNTYFIPQLDIVGEKIWSNDTPEHRPESLTISLYRMIEGGEPEYVTETTTSALDEWFYDFGEQDETDNDGNVYTYSIQETVPSNYNEDYASPYYVEDVLNLDVENTLVMGDLYILKTDMDGNPILDNPAEFKLTRIDPEVADPFTETLSTDAEGKLVFTDLLAGTYRLEETKAPLGFNLYPDDFIITIAKGQNGETIVSVEEVQVTEENPLMIKNRPSQSLPDTGSMGTTIFTVLGIALMGGAVYGLNKKKSKQS